MSRVTSYLLLFFTWSSAIASAQPRIVSDFPPPDHAVVITLGRDGGHALADALRSGPAQASALAVLVRDGYIDESLTVLSRIVAADGPELLPGLEAASKTTDWWRDQKRRDEINSALANMVDRAAAAVDRRPREEAAAIARLLLQLRASMAMLSREAWTTALREFVKKYAGTTTALVAESN